MKKRAGALILFATALMILISINERVAAQEIISGNLFNNPGWEAGYYNQDNISQIAVPVGWRMHWLDNVTFDGTEGRPAYRPETTVWNIADAPLDERSLFFRDGVYTLKIFKGYAPMYAAISQDVSGLEVGRKYRIAAPIYVDIVAEYKSGNKVAPWDGSHGFVRFGAGPVGANWLDGSQINYSPYWTGESVNPFYLSMPVFVWDFVATSPDMTVFLEVGSRYPHQNNGFFMDGVGLFALDVVDVSGVGISGVSSAPSAPSAPSSGNSGGSGAAAAPAPPPTAVPVEVTPREDGSIVHIVGPGDSFWTIANKYSGTLGIAAEEALPVIQELNGNPQFINGGQELLIREPGEYADNPSATEEDTAAAEEGDETAAEDTTEDTSGTDSVNEAETEEAAGESTEGDAGDSEEVIVVEGEPIEEETEEPPAAAGENTVSGICVAAFNDSNGNGIFDGAPESLKADAAITLFKDGKTVTTHITDGVTTTHCFENLESGTYQVQLYPPANYLPTTSDSWAISVAPGVFIPLEFGMQYNPGGATEVADATGGSETAAAAAVSEAPASSQAEDTAASDSSGLLTNLGGIIVIVAVILVLLAGAGVVMLRRS